MRKSNEMLQGSDKITKVTEETINARLPRRTTKTLHYCKLPMPAKSHLYSFKPCQLLLSQLGGRHSGSILKELDPNLSPWWIKDRGISCYLHLGLLFGGQIS